MAAVDSDPVPGDPPRRSLRTRLMQAIASPGFQAWAARFPLTRGLARRDGERLFDLVAGFAYSQVLLSVVRLGVLDALREGPGLAVALARNTGLSVDRMTLLCNAAVSLDLLKRRKDGQYELARLGAATLGVPGLRQMIEHHPILYRDLEDPVAFLRGETDPEMADFWPYVRGEAAKTIPDAAARQYSILMAESQRMVAEETLNTVDFGRFTHLLDVGGGTGAFLSEVRERHAEVELTLFDLPAVIDAADPSLGARNIRTIGGSFLDELPRGADAISLVRVLYDHSDDTVSALLARAHDALESGGTLIVSEPMTGGAKPNRSGNVYFALYTLAMTTGCARSSEQISQLLEKSGFTRITHMKSPRPFVTSVVTARKA